jgi:hypothetical protein
MRDGSAPTLSDITDRHLRDVVAAALSPDPDDRPTADEILDALTTDSSAWSPRAKPDGSGREPAQLRVLRPSLGLAAVVLLLIAVLLLWASGVFRVIAREFAPFEQGAAERSSARTGGRLGRSARPVRLLPHDQPG